MSFLSDILNWILSLFSGGGSAGKPIEIGAHVFMPLFYRNLRGGIDGTWNYLSKSDPEKLHLRKHLMENAQPGETPAITFILTPQAENGGLVDDKMLAVTDGMLDYLEAKCKELIEDGIAIFLCLYVDDKSPRWYEIEKHMAIWTRIHGRVGKYITGAILSIETNEKANNKAQIEGCINVMRAVMPGLAWYGTHLTWRSGGAYSWNTGNAPANASIILMETSNDPHRDVPPKFVIDEYYEVKNSNPGLRFVVHESNLNVGSQNQLAARAALRNAGAWGVG